MAAFLVKDAHAIMNALVRQATAQTDLAVVDTSSFIDAGSKVLATGTDNVMESIAKLIGKVYVSSRPYTGKFKLISATDEQFSTRMAKISVYARDNEESGAFNTDLNTNIEDGLNDTSGAGSMWEQNIAKVVERFFLSEFAWEKSHTTPMVQLQDAFRNEAEFVAFMNGIMVEVENDIQSTIEAKNRMVVADRIAGTKLMVSKSKLGAECAVNLTKVVNDEFGTAWTTKEILEQHNKELLEVLVAKIKIDSDRLTERTALYHDPMTIAAAGSDPAYNILRHTPKASQKFMYYGELFTKAKTKVMPEIFNTEYLDMKNGESVNYWQSSKEGSRSKISIKPALPDGAVSENVTLDYVVGILFDTDAMMVTNQFTGVYTTPVNAKHLYYNTFWHYKMGVCQDYTENAIIYYLADEV